MSFEGSHSSLLLLPAVDTGIEQHFGTYYNYTQNTSERLPNNPSINKASTIYPATSAATVPATMGSNFLRLAANSRCRAATVSGASAAA
jgi:hypothetical protein